MLSIRLNPKAEKELKEHAEFEGLNVSEFVRKIINEKLEDMYDTKLADEAHEYNSKHPKTYTMDEMEKELGLD